MINVTNSSGDQITGSVVWGSQINITSVTSRSEPKFAKFQFDVTARGKQCIVYGSERYDLKRVNKSDGSRYYRCAKKHCNAAVLLGGRNKGENVWSQIKNLKHHHRPPVIKKKRKRRPMVLSADLSKICLLKLNKEQFTFPLIDANIPEKYPPLVSLTDRACRRLSAGITPWTSTVVKTTRKRGYKYLYVLTMGSARVYCHLADYDQLPRALKYINQRVADLGIAPRPRLIVVDLNAPAVELAAYRSEWPGVAVKCCLKQYVESVYAKFTKYLDRDILRYPGDNVTNLFLAYRNVALSLPFVDERNLASVKAGMESEVVGYVNLARFQKWLNRELFVRRDCSDWNWHDHRANLADTGNLRADLAKFRGRAVSVRLALKRICKHETKILTAAKKRKQPATRLDVFSCKLNQYWHKRDAGGVLSVGCLLLETYKLT